MAKHNWNVTQKEFGSQIWVSNAFKEIYIGENTLGTSEELRKTRKVAEIICNALNDHNPYLHYSKNKEA